MICSAHVASLSILIIFEFFRDFMKGVMKEREMKQAAKDAEKKGKLTGRQVFCYLLRIVSKLNGNSWNGQGCKVDCVSHILVQMFERDSRMMTSDLQLIASDEVSVDTSLFADLDIDDLDDSVAKVGAPYFLLIFIVIWCPDTNVNRGWLCFRVEFRQRIMLQSHLFLSWEVNFTLRIRDGWFSKMNC